MTKSKKVGRPSKIDDVKLQKLREGFLKGYNDEEACQYADIKVRNFYDYQAKHPEFLQEKEQWKLNPILKAKDTIMANLNDVNTAKWYLERKRKDEFSATQKADLNMNLISEPIEVKFI